MKFYESSFSYDYSFPTVTLAYFLRYPNPYSKHVISTDVVDRYVDSETGRLHTTRLVLKKSKVPSAMLKLLPKGLAGPGGASQSYVVETSTVDVKEGWMKTESRNMEWTGILSVVENQTFRKEQPATSRPSEYIGPFAEEMQEKERKSDWTSVNTVVTFVSRLGQAKLAARRKEGLSDSETEAPRGFFATWSTNGIQRTIEMIGVKKSQTALVNGRHGMDMVLDRLRTGGIIAALEGMRRDREEGLVPA